MELFYIIRDDGLRRQSKPKLVDKAGEVARVSTTHVAWEYVLMVLHSY